MAIDELEVETFLATTIIEVAGLSDGTLRTEFLSLNRKRRMKKIKENDLTRLTLIESEIAARRAEKSGNFR